MAPMQIQEEVEEPPQCEDILYVFNMSEDVLPFIKCLPSENQQNEIAENARLSGREYLGIRAAYPHQHVTMISPFDVDLDYIDYVDDLIDGSGSVYVPRIPHEGTICNELMNDDILFKRVTRRDYRIVSYCNSPELYRLLHAFKDAGALMQKTDIPAEASWQVVERFGTKTGIRELVTKLNDPQLYMSPGKIFEDFDEAVADAANRPEQMGVVIKTHKGHAGMGVVIFPPHSLSHDEAIRCDQIKKRLLEEDGYWDKFPIVVENYVPTNQSIGGGFPNIEGHINEKGEVHINYPCGMRIISGGVFAGVELGKDVLDQAIVDQMMVIGTKIGNIYAKEGYQGFFELDFLAGLDGKLYVSESNIRRNGGTYAYQLGKYLFGNELTTHHYVVTQLIPINRKDLTFGQIFDATRSVQLEEGREVGVVLTAPDVLPLGKLGYFIVAENRLQAIDIEQRFLQQVDEIPRKSEYSASYCAT